MTQYYHPKIETMSRKELDKLQGKLLKKILARAWNSKFYNDRWSSSGLHHAPSCEEFSHLPTIGKEDLVASYPYGLCTVPLEDLSRMHLTSGSSGRPVAVFLSHEDIDTAADLGARSYMMRGIRRGDVIQITLAYGLWAAALSSHYSAERLGCLVIPSGPGNTERQIWLMREMKTTVLNAVPSYHLRIAEVGERLGVDFTTLPLRIALSTAGTLAPDLRKEIEERLDADVRNTYGMTEVGGIGSECDAQDGLHTWHDSLLLEVVDPKSGEAVSPGEKGELVVTTLRRYAMPLIRYRTGDLVSILSEEPCVCGRTHMRLSGDISRMDETLKIRGVLLSPKAIERHIKAFPELSGRFLIQVRARTSPKIICEMRPHVETAFEEELRTLVTRELKNKIGLTFRVSLTPSGKLPPESLNKRIQVIPDAGR